MTKIADKARATIFFLFFVNSRMVSVVRDTVELIAAVNSLLSLLVQSIDN
jgi:hypothetical protein